MHTCLKITLSSLGSGLVGVAYGLVVINMAVLERTLI